MTHVETPNGYLVVERIGGMDVYRDDCFVCELNGNLSYYMKDEKPIFSIQLTLQQKEACESDDYPPYTEKDGYYWVYINVETGIIEDIQYEPDLNSNG